MTQTAFEPQPSIPLLVDGFEFYTIVSALHDYINTIMWSVANHPKVREHAEIEYYKRVVHSAYRVYVRFINQIELENMHVDEGHKFDEAFVDYIMQLQLAETWDHVSAHDVQVHMKQEPNCTICDKLLQAVVT